VAEWMGKGRVSSIWALPRRACFRFQIPTLDHFLSFQFPRTNLKPAQRQGPIQRLMVGPLYWHVPADCWTL
jgi:hypothetical protein